MSSEYSTLYCIPKYIHVYLIIMEVVQAVDDVEAFGHPCTSVYLFDQWVEAGNLRGGEEQVSEMETHTH